MGYRIKITHRLQEFLADRFTFIQYPNVRAVSKNAKLSLPIRFKHQMPWYTRIALAAVGLFGFLIFGTLSIIGLIIFKTFVFSFFYSF